MNAFDGNVRNVLSRWTNEVGWTFRQEHWTVNRDLPIVAAHTYRGDFRNAARQLLASSELTDLALQPCFYSNKVMRVIPVTERCDRSPVGSK